MLVPIILAGGSGTRLWPLSRSQYPKQFIPLASGKSMLQETIERLSGLSLEMPVTICHEDHRFLIAEQLRPYGNFSGKIILEPERRNTAPAIAAAAHYASKNNDPLLLVLPSDHRISDHTVFQSTINSAIPLATAGKLVTFGVKPSSPNTGYGYIKCGAPLLSGFAVEHFAEKPTPLTAAAYVESGNYYWNSGIFLFKASRYLNELNKFSPSIAAKSRLAVTSAAKDLDFIRLEKESYSGCPSSSIDYAVMEHTQKAAVVPLKTGWNDMGSWTSMWDEASKDNAGNATLGDVVCKNSRNCFIHSKEKLVTTIGLQDTIIIDTKDALLVAQQESINDISDLIKILQQKNRKELHTHYDVYRPWGKYRSIDRGARFQVKKITVEPGGKLSLQKHHNRAEHWIVVSGTAKVTKENKTFFLSENQSTYIPINSVHSLENPEEFPLEMIEVQSGSYLGEDDIVRLKDYYGRT